MPNCILSRLNDDTIIVISFSVERGVVHLSENECHKNFGYVPARETSPTVEHRKRLIRFLEMNYDLQDFEDIKAQVESGLVRDLQRTKNNFVVYYYDGSQTERKVSTFPKCGEVSTE